MEQPANHTEIAQEVDNSLLDPVEAVTNLLIQNHHPEPTAWQQYLNADALDANKPESIRRFLVNRALRTVLGTAPTSAPAERYCLIDKGEQKVWLSLFTETVLPVMINFKLPQPWNEVPAISTPA